MASAHLLRRLNARIVALERVGEEKQRVAVALGSARRSRRRWMMACLVLAASNALTLSALWVFVTPESFRAFREGIAIQLIRTGTHDMVSLQARRSFAVVVERALYETPLAAARFAVAAPLLAPAALAAAAATRMCCGFDDARAVAVWLAIANSGFLGDDLGLRSAPQLFAAAGFAVATAAGVLVLPPVCRWLAPPSSKELWSRCRNAALGIAVASSSVVAEEKGVIRRLVERQRRGGRFRVSSWATGVLCGVAAVALLVDTAIAHD